MPHFSTAPFVHDLLDVAAAADFMAAFGVELLGETSAVGIAVTLPAPLLSAVVSIVAYQVVILSIYLYLSSSFV